MSFLLDTDICSAYLKGDRKVWQKFMQHKRRLHISAITAAELFAWTLRAKVSPARQKGVLDLLDDLTFHDVDRSVSHKFGEIRRASWITGSSHRKWIFSLQRPLSSMG